jgi:quinol-cytochrome oxidoreductase complex cytochrome b subunit
MQDPETEQQESIPFFPDHVRTEARVVLVVVILACVIGLLGLAFPVGLEAPADPMNTPLHVKPEWYFLALYQLLKYIPKTLGVIAPILAVTLLALLPFIDRKPDRTRRIYFIRLAIAIVLLVVLTGLTIWGGRS